MGDITNKKVTVKEAKHILKENEYRISDSNVDSFVSLKDINKIYPNGVQAVYDFNIDVNKNEFIVLVGPSGCGKSTTLRMIAGLESITSGYLYIDKVLSNHVSSKNRNISMVFQNYALYPQMSVYDNIAFPLRARKYKKEIKSEIIKGIDEAKNIVINRIDEYSEASEKASDKSLNYTTRVAYIAEALKVSDEAIKLLKKFKVNRKSDFEIIDKNNAKRKNNIVLTLEDLREKKIKELTDKGFELDSEYCILKNAQKQYKFAKLTEEEIRNKVFEAAEILDLGAYLDRRPRELSGGQMQRVALGRAIVRNTKFFLMDEPLSNLDAKLRVQMRSEIVRIHEQIGATTIYVTHDQTEAMTMANKIVVMSKGWVQQIGTPEDIYNNPKNIFVATFIGSPAMNIYDATYDKNKIIFNNGFEIKLTKEITERHDNYFKNKISELEQLLKTDDFLKLKAIKEIDEVLFNKECHYSIKNTKKIIYEIIGLSKVYEFGNKVRDLLSRFVESDYTNLSSQITNKLNINLNNLLLKVKEAVTSIQDDNGKSCLMVLDGLLKENNNSSLDLIDELNTALKEVEKLAEEIDDKNIIRKVNELDFSSKYPSNVKKALVNIRKPLLTFDKISSSDLNKLHNAQMFTKDEKKQSEPLYYVSNKKNKKKAKKAYNVNSSDIEFINNLYDVAVNLLNKSQESLSEKHSIRVGIRPEDIHFNDGFVDKRSGEISIQTSVVELLGSELLLYFPWAGRETIAKVSTNRLIKPHESVSLRINSDKMFIFDDACGDVI